MDTTTQQRLAAKYGSSSQKDSGSSAATMNVTGKRGNMGATGKPKEMWKTIRRLLTYLSKERFLFFIALFCSIVFTIANLIASYILRPIMNKFIYFDASNPDLTERLQGLGFGLGVMAVVYAVAVFSQWAQQRIMLTVSQNSLKHMRNDLYRKIQSLPMRYFDTHATGDIMSRFTNDVDAIGEMLNTTLIQIISGAITIVGTIILMLYTNPILGAITIVMTPLLTLASKLIIKYGQNAYIQQQRSLHRPHNQLVQHRPQCIYPALAVPV